MKMRVLGSDQTKVDPKTTPNIHKCVELLEAIIVDLKNVSHNDDGGVVHGLVEDMVEPWVQVWVLKGMHPVHPVECYPSFLNRTFQLPPVISMQLISLSEV